MARSGETIGKKENEKKKKQKAREKAEKREERKNNPNKSTDEYAYIDENGNLSGTPPDPTKKIDINLEDIQLGAAPQEAAPDPNAERTGVVTFFNESKGYGFIKDSSNGESIFVHINALTEPIKETMRVTFKTENTPKGKSAVQVKKA